MLECGLRLGGYGYNPSFFIEDEVDKLLVCENPKFAYRFFPKALARVPQPNRLSREKPADVFRILVFGGSAAMGDPEPAYGFSRVFERLLSRRFPNKKFEVVNTAVTAINSHVVRSIAADCVSLDANLWIVYMGNNEVNGPFGCGSVFGPQSPPLKVIRAGLAFKRLRLGQLMSNVTSSNGGGDVPTNWGGMEMFLNQQVSSNDRRLERVYDNFASNLADIVDIAASNGTQLIISTVPTNLPQSPPFTSQKTENEEWMTAFAKGEEAFSQAQWSEAEQTFRKALTLHEKHAETHYLLGHCLKQQDKHADAKAAFIRARDEDTLRFRADSQINDVIRKAGKRDSVALVDADPILSGDPQYFHEHVHLTFAGNYQLACLIGDQAVIELELEGQGKWVNQEECATDLGLTPFHRKEILADMSSRLRLPPFSGQRDHKARNAAIEGQIASLIQLMTPQAGQEAMQLYQKAISERPKDWQLKRQYARLLQSVGQEEQAVRLWESVISNLPHDPMSLFQLGSAYNRLNQYAKAEKSLRQAVALRDRHPRAWNSLGICLSHLDRFAASHKSFAKAVALKPDYGEAYTNWGLVLANQGDPKAALRKYQEAMKESPTYFPAYQYAGKALSRAESFKQAELVYQKLLAQLPNDPGAYLNLALVQLRQSKWQVARKNLKACLRLDPSNDLARQYLKQLSQR